MRDGRTLHWRRDALSSIQTRTVWYFHGFDPATTARYRRIFAAASERFDVGIADLSDGADGWTVTRRNGTAEVRTDIRYCRYEDLVRAYRAPPLLSRLVRGFRTLAGYLADRAFLQMARLGPRSLSLLLAMPLLLAGPVLTGLALAGITGLAVGIFIAVVTAMLLPVLFIDVVVDLFGYMRLIARGHSAAWQAYRDRIRALGAQITPPTDPRHEVLIVGHSLGAIAAVLAAADMVKQMPDDARIGLVTLGSVHGLVLAQSGSGREAVADAIRAVTSDRRIFWVDVTATRDAFCLPLVDPLLMTGGGDGAQSPLILSAQLTKAPRIPGDRRTAFRAMRRHMGYLLAPQAEGRFDYTDVVTGARSLTDKFADAAPSPRAKLWRA